MLLSDLKEGDTVVVTYNMFKINSERAGIPVLNKTGTVISIDHFMSYPVLLEVESVQFRILEYDIELLKD